LARGISTSPLEEVDDGPQGVAPRTAVIAEDGKAVPPTVIAGFFKSSSVPRPLLCRLWGSALFGMVVSYVPDS